MNKKIAELMKDCYIPLVERNGDNEYDMEKFAELIIKECINVVHVKIDDSIRVAIAIETHFGIG